MGAMNCPACNAENPDDGKYCTQCGTPLPKEEQKEEKGTDRFRTLVAILIAIVSLAGAALAYRITLAAGSAADGDVTGIVSSINLHQARVASEAELYRDLRAYLQGHIHNQLSHDLFAERDEYPAGDPAQDRLWDEAWIETRIAEAYLNEIYVPPEHLRPDGSYDGPAALNLAMAHRALDFDFDRERHFSEADRLRRKVQSLIGVALVLAVVLLFYTLAEVTQRAVKYVFLALGTATLALAIIAALVIELTLA
jgi:predicted nucleic acid-binding Zn ribbon protein